MEIESREWTAQDLTSQLVMQRPWLADWKYRYNRCTNRGSPVSCFHRCLSHYFKKKNTQGEEESKESRRFFAKVLRKRQRKKRKVEKRIFRDRVCGVKSKADRTYFRGLRFALSLSTCGPWKLLLTRPSLRETFAKGRTKSRGRPASVRRPESGETRNGFLRFRRWQDERRVICLLSVDDKAIPTTLHGCSPYPRNGKGDPRPFSSFQSLVQRLSTRIYLHHPLSILLPLAEKLRRRAPRWIRPIIFYCTERRREKRRRRRRYKEIIFFIPCEKFRKIGRSAERCWNGTFIDTIIG